MIFHLNSSGYHIGIGVVLVVDRVAVVRVVVGQSMYRMMEVVVMRSNDCNLFVVMEGYCSNLLGIVSYKAWMRVLVRSSSHSLIVWMDLDYMVAHSLIDNHHNIDHKVVVAAAVAVVVVDNIPVHMDRFEDEHYLLLIHHLYLLFCS